MQRLPKLLKQNNDTTCEEMINACKFPVSEKYTVTTPFIHHD